MIEGFLILLIIFFVRSIILLFRPTAGMFRYSRKNGSWRAYFVGNPPSRNHILHDSDGHYVCWSTPLHNRQEARQVARLWMQQFGSRSRIVHALFVLVTGAVIAAYFSGTSSGIHEEIAKMTSTKDILPVSIPPNQESRRPAADNDILDEVNIEPSRSTFSPEIQPEEDANYFNASHPTDINKTLPDADPDSEPKKKIEHGALVYQMDTGDKFALNKCFENHRTGLSYGWNNPNNGSGYRVVMEKTWSEGGRPCRQALLQKEMQGVVQSNVIVACRDQRGIWEHMTQVY